jgi:hypothetical protein
MEVKNHFYHSSKEKFPSQLNGSKVIKISRTNCTYELEATNIDNVSFNAANRSLGWFVQWETVDVEGSGVGWCRAEYVRIWRERKHVSYSITSLNIWYHKTAEVIEMKQGEGEFSVGHFN